MALGVDIENDDNTSHCQWKIAILYAKYVLFLKTNMFMQMIFYLITPSASTIGDHLNKPIGFRRFQEGFLGRFRVLQRVSKWFYQHMIAFS